jgi:hypothetical protein
MKVEQPECFETSVYKIQKPENHSKKRIRHSEHGKVLNQEYLVFITQTDDEILFGLCVVSVKVTAGGA